MVIFCYHARFSGYVSEIVLHSLAPMVFRSDPADWTDARHRLGADGEAIARDFLEERGWTILAQRFRMGRTELDFVARKDHLVAFVEVKTRTSIRFGSPLEAVPWHKQRDLGRVAQAWIDRRGVSSDVYRFDVIGITLLPGAKQRIDYVEDAFRLMRR
jgi:putative endonuclease